MHGIRPDTNHQTISAQVVPTTKSRFDFSAVPNVEAARIAFNEIRQELLKRGIAFDAVDFLARQQIVERFGNITGYDADPITLPEPIPLTNNVKAEYVGFNVEAMFPKGIADAIEAVHEHVKLPEEMAAASILANCAFAAQSHYDVINPKGIVSPSSLFLLTIGESGERKSASDKTANAPTRNHQKTLKEDYEKKLKTYKAEISAWTAKYKAIMRNAKSISKNELLAHLNDTNQCGPKPELPLNYKLLISNPTIEGISTHFQHGHPSAAIFSDEGSIFLGGYSMKESRMATVAVLSNFWGGEDGDRTRKNHDDSYLLEGRRTSFNLLVQPETVEEFVSDRVVRGQGFFARCLISWPKSTIGTRFIEAEELDETLQTDSRILLYNSIVAYMLNLKWAYKKDSNGVVNYQELQPIVVGLSDEAKHLWLTAHNWIEKQLNPGMPYHSIKAFGAKMLENAVRIACVFEAYEYGSITYIGIENLQRALFLMQYYAYQHQLLFGNKNVDEQTDNAIRLIDFIHKWDNESAIEITYRELMRFGPLRSTASLLEAIKMLEKTSWLIKLEKKRKNGTDKWLIRRP
jgi:putative DNA primase/helicase